MLLLLMLIRDQSMIQMQDLRGKHRNTNVKRKCTLVLKRIYLDLFKGMRLESACVFRNVSATGERTDDHGEFFSSDRGSIDLAGRRNRRGIDVR